MDNLSDMLPLTVNLFEISGKIIPRLLETLERLMIKLKLMSQIMIIIINRLGNCSKYMIRVKDELLKKLKFLKKYVY